MPRKMLIDATHPEETRVVVADGSKVEEFDFESINKRQITGNIYLAKVTRVEPSLQAAFVDYGGNRHGFLAFAEIHPDYYQIPVADRERLLAEQAAEEAAEGEAEEREDRRGGGGRGRRRRNGRDRDRGRRREGGERPAAEAEAAGVAGADAGGAPEAEGTAGPASIAERGGAEPDARVTAEAGAAVPGDGSAAEAAGGAPAEDGAGPSDEGEGEAEGEAPEVGEGEAEGEAPGEEAEGEAPGEEAEGEAPEEVESLGAEDVQDEIVTRRAPLRRYKIQEVIKVRQILLVQVVKEERGNKGAALTTYLSLAGRYCVLMPNTARGGGISRKITSAADRKKLKEIAAELEVPKGAGLIIRTAGAERSKAEIRRDYEYLQRLWDEVRETTLRSIAPALIYEEGSLIKRCIRDLYSTQIEEVLVEGEQGFRDARDYMKMLMPGQERVVKLYQDPIPLFSRYQVESYLASMFNPVVQLKSGGYIVIGVTEALVAIDVNSGRATREHSIEETALKTNLEAADEIARQLRLRDLAGLIVIDFIDMEERRNNAAVEKRLKERLKSDRARIQVGRISAFGLLELSRQRLRPGMLEATTAPCPHCHGTGLIRSGESLALNILREIEEEGVRQRAREVLVSAPVAVANYLMNQKREAVLRIESRYGISVRIEADASLVSPEHRIERFKTASRVVGLGGTTAPVTVDTIGMAGEAPAAEPDETEGGTEPARAAETARPVEPGGEGQPGGRRRRRRRRRRGDARLPGLSQAPALAGEGAEEGEEDEEDTAPEAVAEEAVPQDADGASGRTADGAAPGDADRAAAADAPEPAGAVEAAQAAAPARRPVRRRRREAGPGAAAAVPSEGPGSGTTPTAVLGEATAAPDLVELPEGRATRPPRAPRSRRRPAREAVTEEGAPAPAAETTAAETAAAEPAPATAAPEPLAVAGAAPAAEPVPAAADAAPASAPALAAAEAGPAPDALPTEAGPPRPKKRGWWSLGRAGGDPSR